MTWYWIALISVAIVLLIYFVLSYIVSRRMSEEMLKPRGANHRSYEQVRREQTELGHVDYEAYDRMEKEPFLLHGEGTDIPGEFIPALVPPAPGGTAQVPHQGAWTLTK